MLLIAGSLCFAGPALPQLPDAASDTAKDVLEQLAGGIIPPVPPVVGGPPSDPGRGPSSLPELPDMASDTAKDVLDQLAAGIIPPVPPVVDATALGLGLGPSALLGLPDAASDTAKDVLDQLAAGIIPPVPSVVDGAGSAFVSGAHIPEPLTLTLLAIGGLALIRRRR